MAVLTDADYTFYKLFFHNVFRENPSLRAEFRAENPSRAQWEAALQALEDAYVAQRLAFKAAIDVQLGYTTSNAFAKRIEDAFMLRRAQL